MKLLNHNINKHPIINNDIELLKFFNHLHLYSEIIKLRLYMNHFRCLGANFGLQSAGVLHGNNLTKYQYSYIMNPYIMNQHSWKQAFIEQMYHS